MAGALETGLELLEGLTGLERYHLWHAARADLLRRLGRREEAAEAYRRALELVAVPAEQEFLERRLRELTLSPVLGVPHLPGVDRS